MRTHRPNKAVYSNIKKIQYELDDAHWLTENHTQRITTKQWRQILLDEQDKIIVCGRSRRLIGKNLGAGVVEISKQQIKEN